MIAIRERQSIVRAWGESDGFEPSSATDFGFWPGMAAPVSGFQSESPLNVLRDGDLSRRFHGWRGQSGRRYVCTVFADAGDALELADAVVIAVARDSDGKLRALAAIETGDLPGDVGLRLFRSAALAQGASEWHVHLLACHHAARQQVMDDLRFVLAQGRRAGERVCASGGLSKRAPAGCGMISAPVPVCLSCQS